MKKVLAILAIISCLSARSQTVTIMDAPTQACINEKIDIGFKFVAPVPGSWTKLAFYFNSGGANDTVYNFYHSDLKFFAEKRPWGANDSLWYLTPTVKPIHKNILRFQCQSSYRNMNMKNCAVQVGITENEASDLPATYTDLMGNKVAPTPNTLLIEKRGNTRRKVIIQE